MKKRSAFKVACIATVDAAFTAPSAAAEDTEARNCRNNLAPLYKRQQMDSGSIMQVDPAAGSQAASEVWHPRPRPT